jgi:antitoxin (DNA-binding transcriptional repressor) of toxin-antitoxin stability system
METISVSELKAKLSAKLKLVQAGQVLTIVDHKHPIAYIAPLEGESLFAREPVKPYKFRDLKPLVKGDPLDHLAEERKDSW